MKVKILYSTILLLFLLCSSCKQEQLVKKEELTKSQTELLNKITSAHDYTILITANSRIHYYLHKTKLTYPELKNFSENKGNILEYSKKINSANINKGNIVYDVQIYEQIKNTIAKSYPLDCDEMLLKKRINNDLNSKTLKFIEEGIKEFSSRKKYSARYHPMDQCKASEYCPFKQLCCRGSYGFRVCSAPIDAGEDYKSGRCPVIDGIIMLDPVTVLGNNGDNNTYTNPWDIKNLFDQLKGQYGNTNDNWWETELDKKPKVEKYPYHDENQNNGWFPPNAYPTPPTPDPSNKPFNSDNASKIDVNDDIIFLINKLGAKGYGHMAMLFENEDGDWYYFSFGATTPTNLGFSTLFGAETDGVVTLLKITSNKMVKGPQGVTATTVNATKQQALNYVANLGYDEGALIKTSLSDGAKIHTSAIKMQADVKNKLIKYSIYFQNCVDGVQDVIKNSKIEVELPYDHDPRPNYYYYEQILKETIIKIPLPKKK